MELSHTSIEKLAKVIVAGMIREAAYRGEEVSAVELSAIIVADPNGETASYFRRTVADSLELIAQFRASPELMDPFPAVAS